MGYRRRDYFFTFTKLCLIMCSYMSLQYLGSYVYCLTQEWLENQEAGVFRWLLGLFYSDWTGVLVQYVFVLGMPFLVAALLLQLVPKEKTEFRKLPGDDLMICLVIALGAGYVFNFMGIIINSAASLFSGKDWMDLNPAAEMMSELTPGMVIYSCLLGPFMEELMFRGLLLTRARRFGDRTAVVFCAVLFGLMHGNITQFLYAAVIGLALGYLAVKSNGLRYNIMLHIMLNSYSVLLVLGEDLLGAACPEWSLSLYSLAVLATMLFLIIGAVIFFVKYGPRMYREVTLANGWPTPYRKYVYLNPGFLLYLLICAAEMLSYLL